MTTTLLIYIYSRYLIAINNFRWHYLIYNTLRSALANLVMPERQFMGKSPIIYMYNIYSYTNAKM